jgi:hypothetical protein
LLTTGTEVFEDVPNSLQVVEGNVIANVLIRRAQDGIVFARPDLKRPDPGVEFLGWQLLFKEF